MVAREKMDSKEEYSRKICERLTEIKLAVEEGISVSEIFRVFKDAEMIGYRPLRI